MLALCDMFIEEALLGPRTGIVLIDITACWNAGKLPTKDRKKPQNLCADSRETEFKPQSLLSLSIFFDGTVMCGKKTRGGKSGLWGLYVWA